MKEVVQIENISVDELTEIIAEKLLAKLETRLAKQNDDDLLTRAETAEILKVKSSTLWNWTKSGRIIAYGIGNRIYYKRGEIKNAIVRIN